LREKFSKGKYNCVSASPAANAIHLAGSAICANKVLNIQNWALRRCAKNMFEGLNAGRCVSRCKREVIWRDLRSARKTERG